MLFDELVERIEEKDIEWYGSDDSLNISLGEYICWFPKYGILTLVVTDEHFKFCNKTWDDLVDHLKEILQHNDVRGLADYWGIPVKELLKEINRYIQDKDYDQVLVLLYSADSYFGILGVDNTLELPVFVEQLSHALEVCSG